MEKQKRSSLTLRLPVQLREWLAEKAQENFTSINDEIIRLIKDSRENEKSGTPA